MARQTNPDKKNYTIRATEEKYVESSVYQSQRDKNKRYDATQDKIILRVPAGVREKIQSYIEKIDEAEETKDKYLVCGRHSMNAFILDLIQRETGIEF